MIINSFEYLFSKIVPSVRPENGVDSIVEDKKPRTQFEYFDSSYEFRNVYFNLIYELNPDMNQSDIAHRIEKDYKLLVDFYEELQAIVSHNNTLSYYIKNYQTLKFKVQDMSKIFPGRIGFNEVFKHVKNDTMVFVQDVEYLYKLTELLNKTKHR